MKKLHVFSDLFIALVFNFIMAMLFAGLTGFNSVLCFVFWTAVSLRFSPRPLLNSNGFLRAGLNKEIWIPEIIEQFWPDGSFLQEADDMSQWVDNNTINLAEAGVEPDVLINNTSYPVSFADRTDVPLALPLNVYDTEGTVVRNAEMAELAYDKRQSIVSQHKNALQAKIALHAANSYGPAGNTDVTPVLDKTGDDAFQIKYFVEMEKIFNDLNVPLDKRFAILTPGHMADIRTENISLFNQIAAQQGQTLFSFKMYVFSGNPYYTVSTKAKKAFGASIDPETDKKASLFLYGGSVMKALGATDMFARLNDPEQKGDIINFQQRALVLPKRAKYLGAIIQ